MARDRVGDPRKHAREDLEVGSYQGAEVWATLYVGDALHRLAKAVEMFHDDDRVEARRVERPPPKPPAPDTKPRRSLIGLRRG